MNDIVIHSQHFGVSDMERMAIALAKSKLFGAQTPEQALALCLVAQAEGRHPASAAADYHIINGRPSKKADAMLRDFIAGGGKVAWHSLTDELADATFSHPAGGEVRISWDAARVKQAGIANAMHTKYPRQMLRARTVSEGVRTVFPAATSGMYVPDEVEQMEPVRNVTPRPEPTVTVRQIKDEPKREATPFDDDGGSGALSDMADALEATLDACPNREAAIAAYNAAMADKGAWDAFKTLDASRAQKIIDRVRGWPKTVVAQVEG